MRFKDLCANDTPPRDLCRGQYLCEICADVMTDDVWPAAESPQGLEVAICAPCRAALTSGT